VRRNWVILLIVLLSLPSTMLFIKEMLKYLIDESMSKSIPRASHCAHHCRVVLPFPHIVHIVSPCQWTYLTVCNCLFIRLGIPWGQGPHLSDLFSLLFHQTTLCCIEWMHGSIFH
jgi:hypothetical protein